MARKVVEFGAADSYEDLLDQVAAIPGRALFNALLAILQLPHATMLCSERKWNDRWGRRIAPEQRPLVLMYPFGPVEFVFDVSQTEPTDRARALPVEAAPFAMDPMAEAGDALNRLTIGVQAHGVRVVSARHGVPLAGKIRRSRDAGVLRLPHRDRSRPPRVVPVRWIVSLNDSHPPTERVATLAHELGHLFCGHVGADRGDPWPLRDNLDFPTREFEAESVARLVFRRSFPHTQLPAYLERILPAGAPVPDHGWTYVTQAADRVLDLLTTNNRRRKSSV